MNHNDYHDAGFCVFGLYGVTDGACDCGFEHCQALYKHPCVGNWQVPVIWSDEQIENMEDKGHFDTGFGVLVKDLLIIDVDARNGGVESFKQLRKDFAGIDECGFVVDTGSGEGSQHYYFRLSHDGALVQTLSKYKGIDFKSSGFVVGAGSMHKSGMTYDVNRGDLDELSEAPSQLVDALAKPEFYRATLDGAIVDVSDSQLIDMLSKIDPDIEYQDWVQIGMAIHHVTSGAGLFLFDQWSARGAKYTSSADLDKKWQSFGKSLTPVGFGTLAYHARAGGWLEPVTFTPTAEYVAPVQTEFNVDLKRPPGFVGELTDWINAQCLHPREDLAVSAALTCVSNFCGFRHVDEMDGITLNLIMFNVAGSSSGKESILQSINKIMKVAGVQAAVYGGMKSEQEVYRNLLRHQCALYVIDELGFLLSKVQKAQQRGGAVYLEAIIGVILSVFSKANGFLPITGDQKEEIKKGINNEIMKALRKAEKTGDAKDENYVEILKSQMEKIDDGIESPYLTMAGWTTPVNFDGLFDFEMATNGLMSRAMIFSEQNNNPRRRRARFKKTPMPHDLESKIRALATGGSYSAFESRVGCSGRLIPIKTEKAAIELLDATYEHFWEMAEVAADRSGLEAIPRRGYEMTSKVSLVLAAATGVRTAEHVRWATELVKRDIERKMRLVLSNTSKSNSTKLQAKLIDKLGEVPVTLGKLVNACRSFDASDIEAQLEEMVGSGQVKLEISEHPVNKRKIKKYHL